MATAERSAHVTWEGDLKGSGEFDVGSGALSSQQVTWARRSGDPEGHTSPEELIAAAHATCYAMALSNTLAKGGNAPERLEVEAVVALDLQAGKITTSVLTVRGTVPGLDESAFQEAAEQGEQACPVSNALRGNLDISVNASLAS
jgi:lipoyl-dependent peroxiredoxin